MLSQTHKNQNGFSLIEMMIAMLIGLFLMGGVISVYISSSQSSQVNNGLRTLQENGRFALITLRNSIQMSGYIDSYDPSVLIDPFPAASDTSLTVRYQADNDCTGASTLTLPIPNTGYVQDVIQIAGGELTCTTTGGVTETIIGGVDQIRILYGLDDNNDGVADRYVKAATINGITNGWRDMVNSVRIALLMNSVTNIKQSNETKTYTLLDTTTTITDRMVHRVFTTTILIRNRMS